MERWIEHLVEPRRLILAWRAPVAHGDRRRWGVGELEQRCGEGIFRYFIQDEFAEFNDGRTTSDLKAAGFRGYPAFQWNEHEAREFDQDALDAFLRRLPSPHRSDFGRFIQRFHLRSGTPISPFSLLGVTGASLPSDGFYLVDPLSPDARCQDVVIEIAGADYYDEAYTDAASGTAVHLVAEPMNPWDVNAVRIELDGRTAGYVSRFQSKSVATWLRNRTVEAWVLRLSRAPVEVRTLVFMKVRENEIACAYEWA